MANDENGGLLSTAAKLAILTSLVGGAAWVARRRRPVEFLAEQTSVCILARHTVGVRSEVIVLEAAGEKLLLGVTPAGISLLANLTDPSEATAREMDRKPLENRLDAVLSAGLRDATAKASENSQEYALRRDENRRDENRRDENRRDENRRDENQAEASPPPSGRSLRQTSKQTSLDEHDGDDADEASSRFVAAPKPSRSKSNPSYPDMAEGQVRGLARARAKA
jgi:flagellar protein FliO/FliZ